MPTSFRLNSFLTLSLTIVFCSSLAAQTTENSVRATVNRMFFAMKNADSSELKSVFSESAVLQTIGQSKEGEAMVRTENISGFISFVGKTTKGDADEQIVFGAVHLDGALASVWTPYRFFYKGKFSHCGVNSFQLVRIQGDWKIQYIIDTRRKENCE